MIDRETTDNDGWEFDEKGDLAEPEQEVWPARVVLLDDDEKRISLVQRLEVEGMKGVLHQTPDAFLSDVLGDPEPAVLIVDHDLGVGAEVTGYTVVKQVREKHPYGLVLPVIYFSGRETQDGFVEHAASDLLFAPNAFVRKGSGTEIVDVVVAAQRMIDHVVDLTAEQSLRQALIEPHFETSLENDDFDQDASSSESD